MTHNPLNLKSYRSILCLNGDLPAPSFFAQVDLPVVAADGAANRLFEIGISPISIIGDLDSVRPELLKTHSFVHLPDQDSNDYQKTLGYLTENNLLPAIVIGINGGHLDHVLNNINIFMESNCLLYAPPIKGLVLNTSGPIHFTLPLQSKISLIGIPEALISSNGLQWELDHTHLSFPGYTSCFNRTRLPDFSLQIHQGQVLVLIYEQSVNDAGNATY